MLGTVTRAGKALDLFTQQQPTWGATAVSRELGIAKSQAHELLVSLSAIGLLRRQPGGQYRLGWRTLALGRDVLRGHFPDSALQLMRTFALRYQEPVFLLALDRDRLALVARHSTRSPTDALLPDGPLDDVIHCCAMARCLLADLPGPDRARILDRPLTRFTDRTRVEAGALQEELERIRLARIAFDGGEVHADLRAVAVPVKDAAGDTIASFGIWTTAERWAFASSEMTRAVQGAGRRIERAIKEPGAASAPAAA